MSAEPSGSVVGFPVGVSVRVPKGIVDGEFVVNIKSGTVKSRVIWVDAGAVI